MADEVFCTECGHRNSVGDNFCSACGTRLSTMGETEDLTLTLHPLTAEGEPGQRDVVVHLDSDSPPVLILERGSDAGLTFALGLDETTAGRHPDCDVFLDDVTVSRKHAVIRHTDSVYEISDLGSLNGTYVNNERITQQALRSGDELLIGKFRLLFLDAANRRRSER